jgi:hypothetical protein
MSGLKSGLVVFVGLGLLAVSCSQKSKVETGAVVENETTVAGFSNTFLLKEVDQPSASDETRFAPIPSMILDFQVENGPASNIQVELDKLNNGWKGDVLSTTCDSLIPMDDSSSVCEIQIKLDPTDINIGNGDLVIPFSYDTSKSIHKNGSIRVAYTSKYLKWKSSYTQYNNENGYYQSSAVALSKKSPGVVYFVAGNTLYATKDNGFDKNQKLIPPTVLWTQKFDGISELYSPVLNADESSIYLNSSNGFLFKISGDIQKQNPSHLVVTKSSGGSNNGVLGMSSATKPIVFGSGETETVGVLQAPGAKSASFFSIPGSSLKVPYTSFFDFPANWGFLRSAAETDANGNFYVSLSSPYLGTTNGSFFIYKAPKNVDIDSVRQLKIDCQPISTPSVDANGIVYSGTYCGSIVGADFSKDSPSEAFHFNACQNPGDGACEILTKPAIGNDSTIYFGTGRNPNAPAIPVNDTTRYDNTFYAVDSSTKNGAVKWCYRRPLATDGSTNLHDRIAVNPLVDHGVVYAISNNNVMAFDPKAQDGDSQDCLTGDRTQHAPLWSFNIRDSGKPQSYEANGMSSNPLISADGKTMYVMSNSGFLYALNLQPETK